MQKLETVTPALTLYTMRSGPDGLTLLTARRLGEPISWSWLVSSADAEESVLDEWAELDDAVLGYPPNW